MQYRHCRVILGTRTTKIRSYMPRFNNFPVTSRRSSASTTTASTCVWHTFVTASTAMRLASHSLASAVANAQPAARVLPRPSVCIFCQQNSFLPRSQPLSTSAHRRTSPLNPIVSRPRTREHEVVFRHASIRHASTSRVVEPVEESNDILLDEAQAREDARRYKLQLQRDEKTAQQAEVENAPNHQDYVPATTWDGLEMVGGEKEWDAGRKFKRYEISPLTNLRLYIADKQYSFLPKTKFETPEELTIAVYRAVVEIFAAYTAGRTPRTSQTYHVGPLVNEALQVKVNHDINSPGKVTLEYPSKAIERAVLKAGQTKSQDPDVSASAPAETLVTNASRTNLITSFNDTTIKPATQDTTTEDLAKIIASLGHSWLHIPLTDPKIKFAVSFPLSHSFLPLLRPPHPLIQPMPTPSTTNH